MSLPVLLFIVSAVILVVVLAWAVRPPKRIELSIDQVFDTLSERRHYARLPQILQALRPEDAGFLRSTGHGDLATQLSRKRKRIALQYLSYLEQEYQLLLEVSRILAKVSPEISTMDELARFRLNLRFVLSCRYLKWRLRFGLQPWDLFGILSDMEGDMALQLEMATTRIGERAAIAADFPLFLENRRGDSE
jgi:hypothetical protein